MLKIESLTRRYPHVTALDGLNMEIGHGQLYGFVETKRCRKNDYDPNHIRITAADFRKSVDRWYPGRKGDTRLKKARLAMCRIFRCL